MRCEKKQEQSEGEVNQQDAPELAGAATGGRMGATENACADFDRSTSEISSFPKFGQDDWSIV